MMMFRPLHDPVLGRLTNVAAATSGGIIIPEAAQEKPQKRETVCVGGGIMSQYGIVEPPDLKAGDRILFGKWSRA